FSKSTEQNASNDTPACLRSAIFAGSLLATASRKVVLSSSFFHSANKKARQGIKSTATIAIRAFFPTCRITISLQRSALQFFSEDRSRSDRRGQCRQQLCFLSALRRTPTIQSRSKKSRYAGSAFSTLGICRGAILH